MRWGLAKSLGLLAIGPLLAAGCFNTQIAANKVTTSSRFDPALLGPAPSPSPSTSPEPMPVIAQCREGSSLVLTSDAILARLPGVMPGDVATLLALAPAVAGEAIVVRSTSTSWTITCPSQFAHWEDVLPGNRFQVSLSYQFRAQGGTTFSGNAAIDVSRWTLAPSWTAAGPATYSVTSAGRILMVNGAQSFILPNGVIPGAGAQLGAPLFYAVAKAPDNVALYAIGSAPQGSALYRVNVNTGELWTIALATLPAPTVDGLIFVNGSELELSSQGRVFRGALPAAPKAGRILETPVDP